MANPFDDHYGNTMTFVSHEEGSERDLQPFTAPLDGYDLWTPVPVIEYVAPLAQGSSAFCYQTQQALLDSVSSDVFDILRGTLSGTTLHSVRPGQEWNSFLGVPHAGDHDASVNDLNNEYHVEYDDNSSSVVSQYNIDQALQGLSSALVLPDPPYPERLVEADLSSTLAAPQQHPSSAHPSSSNLCPNTPPTMQPTGTHSHRSDSTSHSEPDDSDTVIGSFHHSGRFKCLHQSCVHKSFGRQAELRRHYNTVHAIQKPEYWCEVVTCDRSQANGGHPFPRRDKMTDHVRKVHGRP